MTTYTLQRHDPSGEVHILAYDADNRITAASGAIDYRAVDGLAEHPRMLRYCQVNAEDAEWANAERWQPPVAEWEEA